MSGAVTATVLPTGADPTRAGGSARARVAKYFWWLVFFIVIRLVSGLLDGSTTIERFRLSWLDVAAMYGLIGLISMIGALLVAILLARLEVLAGQHDSLRLQAVPRAIVFVCFVAVWSSVLQRLLVVNGLDIVRLDEPVYYAAGPLLLGGIILSRFPQWIARWVDQVAQRLPIIGVVALVASLGLSGYLVVEPFKHSVSPPVTRPSSVAAKPHVIIIVLDALTSHDMSLYGYHLPTTPHLDQLARTWTVFENAHSGATGTIAVQPTILTGRYPYLDEWYRYGDLARQGQGVLSLPHVLRSFGYTTVYGMGGGWSPSQYHLHTGFDRIVGGGYSAVTNPGSMVHALPVRDWLNLTLWNSAFVVDSLFGEGELNASTNVLSEPMYATADQVLREQARLRTPSPLFMYLHMNRPHQPYLGNEFLGRFLPPQEGLADVGSQKPLIFHPFTSDEQAAIDRLRLRYNENILKADQQVGSLMDTLQQSGLYDQSLIIITADHGTSFTNGKHGYYTSDMNAAEHSIPLLVKFPGQTEGQRVDTAVSLVDILPTVLDVIGASYPADWVDGQSLLHAEANPHRTVFVSRYSFDDLMLDIHSVAVISEEWKLLERQNAKQLYNLQSNPNEEAALTGRAPWICLQQAADSFKRRRSLIIASGGFRAATPISSTCPPDMRPSE